MAEYIEKWSVVNRLIDIENEFQQYKPFHGFEHAMYRKICEAEIAIGKTQAADVAPVRHAHWEYWDGWMSNHDMRIECACSACGYKDVVRGYGYDNIKHLPERCHGCWAKMDEEVSRNDNLQKKRLRIQ